MARREETEGLLDEVYRELENGSPPIFTKLFAKKVGAEFIGTFILLFACASTPVVNSQIGGQTMFTISLTAGLAVAIIIFSTGHICGAHLNPSVTISFAALGQFPWAHVPIYIATQVLASTLGAFALKCIFGSVSHGLTQPLGDELQAFFLELIISFVLMFVVTAVSTDKFAENHLAPIAVGSTVLLNNLAASQTTGASMNPVRTLGPAIVASNFRGLWIYIVAPTIGTLLGAGAYSMVRLSPSKRPN